MQYTFGEMMALRDGHACKSVRCTIRGDEYQCRHGQAVVPHDYDRDVEFAGEVAASFGLRESSWMVSRGTTECGTC